MIRAFEVRALVEKLENVKGDATLLHLAVEIKSALKRCWDSVPIDHHSVNSHIETRGGGLVCVGLEWRSINFARIWPGRVEILDPRFAVQVMNDCYHARRFLADEFTEKETGPTG